MPESKSESATHRLTRLHLNFQVDKAKIATTLVTMKQTMSFLLSGQNSTGCDCSKDRLQISKAAAPVRVAFTGRPTRFVGVSVSVSRGKIIKGLRSVQRSEEG